MERLKTISKPSCKTCVYRSHLISSNLSAGLVCGYLEFEGRCRIAQPAGQKDPETGVCGLYYNVGEEDENMKDCTPEELRKLYKDEHLTDGQIAIRLECSAQTVRNRRKKYGIATRRNAVAVDEDSLAEAEEVDAAMATVDDVLHSGRIRDDDPEEDTAEDVIADLRSQISELDSLRADDAITIQNLQETVDEQEKDIDQLQGDNERANNLIAELQGAKASANNLIEDLRDNAHAYEAEISRLRDERDHYRDLFEAKPAGPDADALARENEDLQQQVELLQREAKEKADEIDSLTADLNDAELVRDKLECIIIRAMYERFGDGK